MFLLFCQLLRILSKTKMPVFQAPAKQDLNLRFEWNAKMVFFPPTNFKAWAFLARILIALIRKIHRMIFSNSKGQNCLTLISGPRTNSETFCFLQPFTRLLVLLQSIYNNIRVVLNQKLKGLGILSTLFHRKQHSKIINIIKWQLCFECNTYLVTS